MITVWFPLGKQLNSYTISSAYTFIMFLSQILHVISNVFLFVLMHLTSISRL